MGILQRLFNLFRSNANDLLDKAEDPGKMLQQMLADLEVQKRKAKKLKLDKEISQPEILLN